MATTEVPELVIRSEDDAWQALAQAVDGEGFPDDLQLKFEGWPVFQVDVKGRDWHQTVPTRAMPPLLEVQDVLNRAFAQIRYDDSSTRKLRGDDRDALELVVKVDEGSSSFSADLAQQLGYVAQEAFQRMNGTEATIAVIAIGLLIAAPISLKIWLNERRAEKRMETQARMAHEETERTRLLTAALAPRPPLEAVRDDANAATSKLLKATRSGDQLSVGDVTLHADEAHELAQPERERSKDVEISGEFIVIGNRTDIADGFRVTVRRIADGVELRADVPLALAADQRETIRNAEWSKGPVQLVIDGQSLRGTITRAVVISAEPVTVQHSD